MCELKPWQAEQWSIAQSLRRPYRPLSSNGGFSEPKRRDSVSLHIYVSIGCVSVEPPEVTIKPGNSTVEIGDNVTISCTVHSEALLLENQLLYNGTQTRYGMYELAAPLDITCLSFDPSGISGISHKPYVNLDYIPPVCQTSSKSVR